MKTQNEVKHTPTPWHRNVSPAWKYPIYADKNGDPNGKDWVHIAAVLSGNPNAEADLNFIVKAVNSHEALIDTLKATIEAMKSALNSGPDFDLRDLDWGIERAENAIKQAESY